MKQQQHDINLRRTRKKSESQMGFEPTTLRDNKNIIYIYFFLSLMYVIKYKANKGIVVVVVVQGGEK